MASINGTILILPDYVPCRTDAAGSQLHSLLTRNLLNVRRAFNRQSGPVQYMGVDHRGGDICMPEQTGELFDPFHIENGAIRRYPVFLRAPPIGSPKLVLSSGIVAVHGSSANIPRFQGVKPIFVNHARPQENITIFSGRPLLLASQGVQMDPIWKQSFEKRMRDFELLSPSPPGGTPISIKLRVTSGCFHREHAPCTYSQIDAFLNSLKSEEISFKFEEHESGPEILVYLAVATAGITLAKSVIDLITAIIKARSEGANRGDRCPPLELIVRRVKTDGLFIEEKVLQIGHQETIDSKQIEEKILKAASKLVGGSKKSKQLTRRSSGRGPKGGPRR